MRWGKEKRPSLKDLRVVTRYQWWPLTLPIAGTGGICESRWLEEVTVVQKYTLVHHLEATWVDCAWDDEGIYLPSEQKGFHMVVNTINRYRPRKPYVRQAIWDLCLAIARVKGKLPTRFTDDLRRMAEFALNESAKGDKMTFQRMVDLMNNKRYLTKVEFAIGEANLEEHGYSWTLLESKV